MKKQSKLEEMGKRAVAPIISVITAIISILPSFLKKKQYCLWYHDMTMKWVKKGGPFSYRQCKKTQASLVEMGYADNAFMVLRNGVAP